MPGPTLRIAALLFASGLCALVYQVAWLRELRLVFGASTPASAAVLAVFMGGLGFGGLFLGRRAERVGRPLLLYANLEAGVALCAGISPLLLVAARAAYVATGGTQALGLAAGTGIRLLLAALVLLPPTLLMGGTLPAAARAAIFDEDVRRRSTALLYGANALGAVVGAGLSTFLLLEVFGNRLTLWLGCLVNLLVAVAARALSRRLPVLAVVPASQAARAERAASRSVASAPGPADRTRWLPPFVLAAAGATGFVFLLLELVWYRMLAPLLGGSTYTFGLVLTVALGGIGMGGMLFGWRRSAAPPTLSSFAVSCTAEALCIAAPFALGDRVALWALMLRSFGTMGLSGYLFGWTAIACLVVLPTAIVAGYQFPMLIALLGRGREQVGRQVGLAYATNTFGSIVGSLAGGFVLLPLVTAPGAWKLCVWVLVVVGGVALGLESWAAGAAAGRKRGWVAPALAGCAALAAIHVTVGPTAAWRHSPIGAGRADHVLTGATRNSLRAWLEERRSTVRWEAEGRESSIAIATGHDTAFIVSGKSDGSAVDDSATQVMGGLLGALLHGNARRALVIGLGTGSTAGWLAAIPGMERVDVVEIEPDIVEVARRCAAVNHDALQNPKIRLAIADAREALLTSRGQYDIVFSEPSNPYRAGIASLFTREFYQAVRERLAPGGIFVQWVQGYEIDVQSVRTVYATLVDAFGSVETWRADPVDILLLARQADEVPPIDVAAVRARVAAEPYHRALVGTWRASDLEGVLAHHVAHPRFAAQVAAEVGPLAINTDDRNQLEFGVTRTLGRQTGFDADALAKLAASRGLGRPDTIGGEVDWDRVAAAVVGLAMASHLHPAPSPPLAATEASKLRYDAFAAWTRGDPIAARQALGLVRLVDPTPVELMVAADTYAQLGDEREAVPLIEQLAELLPTDAAAVRAELCWAQQDASCAIEMASMALVSYRTDPWASSFLISRVLGIVLEAARRDRAVAVHAFELLKDDFAVSSLRRVRLELRLELGLLIDDPGRCVDALGELEPHPSWTEKVLRERLQCYERSGHPMAARARADWQTFLEGEGLRVDRDLLPDAPASTAAP